MKRAVSAALVGFVHWQAGDLDAAYQSFTDVKTGFQKAGEIPTSIGLTFILADLRIVQGRLKDAESTFEQSLKYAIDHGEPLPYGTEDVYRGLSELYLERGNMEAAIGYLQKSEELNEQTRLTEWQYRRCLAQAKLKEAQGDLDGVLDILDRAGQLFLRSPLPDVRPVAALKARVWIRQGKLAEALEWVRERGLSYDDELSYLHEFEHLTLARVHIARYRSEAQDRTIHEAMELLERLLKAADEGGRKGSVIEILVLQSLAYEALGNISDGLVPLEQALAFAEPEGYVRIFVDEGNPMARLLSEVAAQGIMQGYTGKLLALIESEKKDR
jgi:LuxR family maltose regulon positive regulatory protein